MMEKQVMMMCKAYFVFLDYSTSSYLQYQRAHWRITDPDFNFFVSINYVYSNISLVCSRYKNTVK